MLIYAKNVQNHPKLQFLVPKLLLNGETYFISTFLGSRKLILVILNVDLRPNYYFLRKFMLIYAKNGPKCIFVGPKMALKG